MDYKMQKQGLLKITEGSVNNDALYLLQLRYLLDIAENLNCINASLIQIGMQNE